MLQSFYEMYFWRVNYWTILSAFFSSFRWSNIAMICICHGVFLWFLDSNEMLEMIWYSVSILFAAGIGFALNDWYDKGIDQRQGRTRPIQRLTKVDLKRGFLIFGIVFVVVLWLQYAESGSWFVSVLLLLGLGSLWVYAAYLKNSIWWGNALVSIFVAMFVFYIPHILFPISLSPLHLELASSYMFFSTLHREWIKDAEDANFDAKENVFTLANSFPSSFHLVWLYLLFEAALCVWHTPIFLAGVLVTSATAIFQIGFRKEYATMSSVLKIKQIVFMLLLVICSSL